MVYCTADGRILQSKPWGLSTISDMFHTIYNVCTIFVVNVINPGSKKKGDGYSTDYINAGKCKYPNQE